MPLKKFLDALNNIPVFGETAKNRAIQAIHNLEYSINDVILDESGNRRTALDYVSLYSRHGSADYRELENEVRNAGGKSYEELEHTLPDNAVFPDGRYSIFQEKLDNIFSNKEEFFTWLTEKGYVSDCLMRAVSFTPFESQNIETLKGFITDYSSARNLFSKLDTKNGPYVIRALGSEHLSRIMSREEFEHSTHDEEVISPSLIKRITEDTKEGNSFYVKYIETADPSNMEVNVFQNALDDTLNLEHNFFANLPQSSVEYFQRVLQMQPNDIVTGLSMASKEIAVQHAVMLQRAKSLLNQPGIFKNVQHLIEFDPDDGRELILDDLKMSSVDEAQKLYSALKELTKELDEEGIRNLSQKIEGLNISSNLRCKRESGRSVCSINIFKESSPVKTEVTEEIGISIEGLVDSIILPITIALDKQASEFQSISQGLQQYYITPAVNARKMARMIYDITEINGLDEIKSSLEKSQDNVRELSKKLESTKAELSEIPKTLFYKDSQEDKLKHQFTDKAMRSLLEFDQEFKETWNILLSEVERNNQRTKELIEKFDLILEKLNGKPELIGSIFNCIDSENVTKVVFASSEIFLNSNNSHKTNPEIREIIKTTIQCLGNNRLEEFIRKGDKADISVELSFYDALKQKMKEMFGGEDIVLKIIKRINKVKSIVNDLYNLNAKNENLIENIKNMEEEYQSYFEDFNIKTYVVKVYDDKNDYKFFSVSLPEYHELNLGEISPNRKSNIVLEGNEKLSKHHYNKYIKGCEKRNFLVEEYLYDNGAVILHGNRK